MLPRSGRRVLFGATPLRAAHGVTGLKYEKTISTIEGTAETPARFPEPQLQQEREGHFGQSQARGPQTPDPGLTRRRMSASPKPLRFGQSARLKRSGDFSKLKARGGRIAIGCLVLNWNEGETARSRLGVVTSARIGSAVVRNRARRLLRECFRLHQHDLASPVDMVLIARQSIAGKNFGDVNRDFLTAALKARLLSRAAGESN